MKPSVVQYESRTHLAHVREVNQGVYVINFERISPEPSWISVSGVYANSFDEAFSDWQRALLNDYPQFAAAFE